MKPIDYIQAWKDPEYRSSLSAEQLASLPEHPCAEIELSDELLGKVAGGMMKPTNDDFTSGCCPTTTYCITVATITLSI